MTKVNNQGTPNLINPSVANRTEGAKVDIKGAGAAAIAAPAAPSQQATAFSAKKDAGAANVKISEGGKDRAEAMNRALDIARNTPDVREDRVAALKKQIQEGTYQVDSGKIADGMLREAVKDHLAETEER